MTLLKYVYIYHKDLIYSFELRNLFFETFIGFMNVVLNSNYMYLMKKPLISNPFIVGEWPFYILGFEVAGILHIFIFYVLFNWLSKKYLVKISV